MFVLCYASFHDLWILFSVQLHTYGASQRWSHILYNHALILLVLPSTSVLVRMSFRLLAHSCRDNEEYCFEFHRQGLANPAKRVYALLLVCKVCGVACSGTLRFAQCVNTLVTANVKHLAQASLTKTREILHHLRSFGNPADMRPLAVLGKRKLFLPFALHCCCVWSSAVFLWVLTLITFIGTGSIW